MSNMSYDDDLLISDGRDIVKFREKKEIESQKGWHDWSVRALSVAPWLLFAYKEIGQAADSSPGKQNKEVLKYLQSCSGNFTNDEVPWCSAFVNWCVAQCGYKGTGDAVSTSWLNWPSGYKLSRPKIGSIVVMKRPHGTGHVGFVWNPNPVGKRIAVLGGNQSASQNGPFQVSIGINIDSEAYHALGYIWPVRNH